MTHCNYLFIGHSSHEEILFVFLRVKLHAVRYFLGRKPRYAFTWNITRKFRKKTK